MRTGYILFIAFSGLSVSLAAQDAVSAAGADDRILSWTLGETVTETLVSADTHITQGFNQPTEEAEGSALSPITAGTQDIRAWPNPVISVLHLGFEAEKRYEWQLFDSASRLLGSGQTATVDCSGLTPGCYLLSLTGGIRKQTIIVIKK